MGVRKLEKTLYLKVSSWDKWQSYRKDRGQPPWIKLHRALLRNPEWISLTDAQRGQLVSIWILAADKDGKIPDSPEIIQRVCCLSKKPDLELLISLGFICTRRQPDANMTPTRRQHDASETETETETETEKTLARFELFWRSVSKKVGKKASFEEFKKLNPDIVLVGKMITAQEVETHTKEVQFHKDPERWIKGRRWEDEPIPRTNGHKPTMDAEASVGENAYQMS